MNTHEESLTIDLAGDTSPAGVSPEIPELREGEQLDLPPGAELQPDGSVRLDLEEAATIRYRRGGDVVREETFDHLVLRRLKGAQIRKVMEAKAARASDLALSLCSGISEAKLRLLYPEMAAPDLVAARQVVSALMDADGDGLPARAVQNDDGSVTLPLLYEASDGDGETQRELTFGKLRADALVAMQNAKDLLGTALHRSTGMSLKAASGLIDDMDGADVMATQRVIGFLSGIGRRSGG